MLAYPAAWAIGVPVGLLGVYVALRGGTNSAREDTMPDDDAGLLQGDALALADSIGWPYAYGRGSPSTPWSEGPNGVDCSGYAQMCLVRLGRLSSSASDRSASGLADACDPIAVGAQEPGDLAYYPGHVVVVASYPLSTGGHSAVLSASGRATDVIPGARADARVKLYDSGAYRSDFVTYMRLKS
jgi:cell wall-associated NlpC family hydrolase